MNRLDPHSYFDETQPRTRSWRLRMRVDFDRKVIHGEATLDFAKEASGVLDLDTKGLTIKRVVVAGSDVQVPHDLAKEEPILGRRLRLNLPKKTRGVTITYTTSPDAIGLQWLSPEQTEGKKNPFLFTQCQAIHARTVLPCQDCAVARVTYEAEVTVPKGLTAVMSAGPAGGKPSEEGWHTFLFKMPQAIPSYLFALAVGELENRDLSHRCRVWAEPTSVEKAAWEFADAEYFILQAESIFGAYVWDRFDMLVLPPSFPYGGMENPRLTFLTPTLLAGDRSLIDVVAHELAHSWTGNLVTNATAEHFWLNEGFTVWAERKILKSVRGEEAAAMAWAIGQKDMDDSLERFRNKPELTLLRTHLKGIDPDDAFSNIPYEKGSRLVAVLEAAAGEREFGEFVRDYMKRFRFQSITTEAFCAFIEEKLPGVLAKAGADAWLHQPGIPAGAPRSVSRKLKELEDLAAGWKEGKRPSDAWIKAWRPPEFVLYVAKLPRDLRVEDCAWLDEKMGLTGRDNYEILVAWLSLALGCGYEPAFQRVRDVLARVGRMKYVRPLYRALGKTEPGRKLAREIFAKASPTYHGLTRRVAESVMADYPA